MGLWGNGCLKLAHRSVLIQTVFKWGKMLCHLCIFSGANYKHSLRKLSTYKDHGMTMCKVEGAKLSNHVLSTVTTSSAASCVAKCSANKNCKSTNYNTSDGTCELNDENGPAYQVVADFDDNSAVTNVHYHSLEC